jgi:predicted TIM-barrel fold metal-dependent hydrolase
MDVFDIHHHIGAIAQVMGTGRGIADPEQEYAARVRSMTDDGVAMAAVLPATGYLQPEGVKDTMRVNDAMAAYRARDPKRFPVACGVVEPLHGERSLEELDRIHHELRLDGVVWHHRFQGAPIDAGIMFPLVRRAGELGLVPFIHLIPVSTFEAPWRLERLALEFPDITFVALDGFAGSADYCHMVMDIGKRLPNVLFDISLFYSGSVFLKTLVDALGSERVLFGSDVYAELSTRMAAAPSLMHIVRSADITETDKANILGDNARRLFGVG